MRTMEWQLVDTNGKIWELNNPDSPVRLAKGGKPDLYAHRVATLWGGEATKGRSRVVPTSGSMTVGFYPQLGVDLNRVRREFRAGWANDSYCELKARWTAEEPWVVARVRLPDDNGLPQRDVLTGNIYDTLTVPLGWEGGCWLKSHRATGDTVKVVNTGIRPVKVCVGWKAGGDLVLPSGATVALPTVSNPRRILLDREKSFPVTDEAGVPDRATQKRLWGKALEERVMPGTTGVFKPPAGGWVEWEIGVAEP